MSTPVTSEGMAGLSRKRAVDGEREDDVDGTCSYGPALSSPFTNSFEASPLVRTSARLTRGQLSQNQSLLDTDNEDESEEPSKKRAKLQESDHVSDNESDNEGDTIMGRLSKTTYVGVHALKREIRVGAFLEIRKSDTPRLHFRALKEETSRELLDYLKVTINKDKCKPSHRVSVAHVLLDIKVFKTYSGNLEAIEKAEVSKIVREYLTEQASGSNKPLGKMATYNEDTSRRQIDRSRENNIHVGYLTEDPDVPVHAYMQYKIDGQLDRPAVTIYRYNHIEGRDAGFSRGSQVKLADVTLRDEFKRDTLKESRVVIRAEHQRQFPRAFGEAEEEEELKVQFHQKVAESAAAFEKYRAHVDTMNTNFGEAIELHNQMLDVADRKAKDLIRQRDETITALEATIRRLQETPIQPKQPHPTANEQLEIDSKSFGIIREGELNAGMIIELNGRIVTIGGKKWREREGLSQCTSVEMVGEGEFRVKCAPIDMNPYVLDGEVVEDGVAYNKYTLGNDAKLLQSKGTSSLVYHDGKFWCKTRVYIEYKASI